MNTHFEYRVVPAPRKGKPGKGLRGGSAKFANAVNTVMNEMGSDGWEYLRADTLPCEERQGLTGKTVRYHSMLVFRRPVVEVAEEISDATEVLASLAAPTAISAPAIAAPAAISEQVQDPPLSAEPVEVGVEVEDSDTPEDKSPSNVAAE